MTGIILRHGSNKIISPSDAVKQRLEKLIEFLVVNAPLAQQIALKAVAPVALNKISSLGDDDAAFLIREIHNLSFQLEIETGIMNQNYELEDDGPLVDGHEI